MQTFYCLNSNFPLSNFFETTNVHVRIFVKMQESLVGVLNTIFFFIWDTAITTLRLLGQSQKVVCSSSLSHWSSNWFKVLRPNPHKIGNFGDVLPCQSFGLILTKTKPSKTNLDTIDDNWKQTDSHIYSQPWVSSFSANMYQNYAMSQHHTVQSARISNTQ